MQSTKAIRRGKEKLDQLNSLNLDAMKRGPTESPNKYQSMEDANNQVENRLKKADEIYKIRSILFQATEILFGNMKTSFGKSNPSILKMR